ncbi:MAG: phosphorylase, partial [Clostridia bacterium]|nr:phosphorylase [Clostridia bacterium]
NEGCIAVEMEVAGVQAVCDFYNFELYNFLVTGDVLCEDNYDNRKLSDANHNLDKLHIALKLAMQI